MTNSTNEQSASPGLQPGVRNESRLDPNGRGAESQQDGTDMSMNEGEARTLRILMEAVGRGIASQSRGEHDGASAIRVQAKDVPKMGDDDPDKIIMHKQKIANICAFAKCNDALDEKLARELSES